MPPLTPQALDARDEDDDDLPTPVVRAGVAKLQRWIDIVASLLARHYPVSFDDLANDVPEYWRKKQEAEAAGERHPKRKKTLDESLKRTFERDKDELRAFGVPIESVPDEDGNPSGAYRLLRKDFYLPYLCAALPNGRTARPKRVDRWGYHALTELTFAPDELQAVVDAAATVRALGDPLLAADAASALRKLAVDLPIDAANVDANASLDAPRVVLPRTRPDAAVFDALSDALVRRKRVTFAYHAMSSDATETREVEPYGLFFLNAHWYLVARDLARGALRNFRLNRIAKPKVNAGKSQSADYEIPETFRLREHAASRHAWELGDGSASEAVVAFVGASGPTVAASKLGRPVGGTSDRRAFDVRRLDTFVRWLLSFAGEALPVSPPELVARYREAAAQVAAIYANPASPASSGTTRSGKQRKAASPQRPWQPNDAAAQLRRVLHVVPRIADGEEHALDELAARVGTDVDTLRDDLFSLTARYDTPMIGFAEGLQLLFAPDRVCSTSNHFARPMRLSVSELCALELGLAVLRARRPPDEHGAIERARGRLRTVLAKLPSDPIPDGLYGASLGEQGSTEHVQAVRAAMREGRKLRLVYRKSGSAEAAERVVCPHATIASNGMLYIVAYCDDSDGIRFFRMDRVERAEALAERFARRPDFSLDAVLRDGPFRSANPEVLRVRYAPAVARWIAEREGVSLDGDGGLVMEHPLADHEWGMRHVLQYGAEAEVLAPAALREALATRLATVAAI